MHSCICDTNKYIYINIHQTCGKAVIGHKKQILNEGKVYNNNNDNNNDNNNNNNFYLFVQSL